MAAAVCIDSNALAAFASGRLSERERADAEQHIDDCPACRQALAIAVTSQRHVPIDEPPQRVAHYDLVEEIGRGGMGVVYAAHDTKLGRTVALKLLHTDRHGGKRDTELRARAKREAQAAASISHPNIATVFEVGEADDDLYIAMELVAGRSLQEELGDPMAPRRALELAIDIARGLSAVHEAGIVHRDLKPANIMVSGSGARLLDFGLAKRVLLDDAPSDNDATLTTQGAVIGTPAYMSPEQARGERTTVASDVFSFGVVAYEMFAGRRPFSGVAAADVVAAIIRDDPPPLRDVAPTVPAALSDVIERCMQKSGDDRYRNAGELLSALLAVGDDFSDKRPRRAQLAIAIAALLLATVALAIGLQPQDDDRPAAAPSAIPASPADEAYARARVLWTGGNFVAARRALALNLKEHNNHAASALYLALDVNPGEDARNLLKTALTNRAQLSEHDAALLDASVALLQLVPDLHQWQQALQKQAKRFPQSTQVKLTLARVYAQRGNVDAALEALAAVERLEPPLAPACAALRGDMERTRYRMDEAAKSYDACVLQSPVAAACLQGQARIAALRGNCDKLERLAQRVIALDRDDPHGYELLVLALVAKREPIASVREALGAKWDRQRKWSHLPTFRHIADSEWSDRYRLAVVEGDFVTALEEAKAAQDAVGSDAALMAHLTPAFFIALAAWESGDIELARRESMSFVERARGWLPEDPRHVVAPLILLSTARRVGAITEAEFKRRRARWLALAEQANVNSGEELDAYSRVFPWVIGYTVGQTTAAQAHEALEALPRFGALPEPGSIQGDIDLVIGRTFELVGEHDKAIVYYEAAADACLLFENPFAYLFAQLEYAQSLRAVGRGDEAQERAERVLSYWRDAKPSSVHADRARAFLKKLASD